jgi:heme oxygenase (mycobilin-producing)
LPFGRARATNSGDTPLTVRNILRSPVFAIVGWALAVLASVVALVLGAPLLPLCRLPNLPAGLGLTDTKLGYGFTARDRSGRGGAQVDRPVLINPFEVPSSQEEFLQAWGIAAEYMRKQPGFVSTRLHRALTPDARFGFVNIAEWESPAHFSAAVGTEEFRRLAAGGPPSFPSLYQVVRAL